MPTLRTLRPNNSTEKEDMSATKKISAIITNGAEGNTTGNVWALVATVFFKYGISPLIVLVFGYWLQICFQQILIKDSQIMVLYDKQSIYGEKVITALDANTKAQEGTARAQENTAKAFQDLKEELRARRQQ